MGDRGRVGRLVAAFFALVVVVPLLFLTAAGSDDPAAFIYVSSSSAGTVDEIPFVSGDVMVFDSVAKTWTKAFDAAANDVRGANVDGFSIDDDGKFLLSFAGVTNVPGIGLVDDSDVVQFDPDAGTFVLLLDGSDVGLAAGGEDVDAIATPGPTEFGFSTLGAFAVPQTGGGTLSGPDEDLITLTVASTGSPTAGTFDRLFDGSDVGQAGEDISGAHVHGDTGVIYLAMLGNYNVGFPAEGDDIVAFTGATGENTSGTFAPFFDGDMHGFGGEQIDALHIVFQETPPQGEVDLSVTKTDDVDPAKAGDTVTYTVTVTNLGPDTAINVVGADVLPAGVTFVSTTGCTQDPNGFPSCSLGDITSGASAQYTISVTIDPGTAGTITNSVSVSSDSTESNPGDETATEDTFVGIVPVAVDDGPATNSVPGDPFHTDTDTTLVSSPAENLLSNDNLGDPPAVIDGFEGGHDAGTTGSFAQGDLLVEEDGRFVFDPAPAFEGLFEFDYLIINSVGESLATASVFVGPRPAAAEGDKVFVSSPTAGSVDGVSYGRADIMAYDAGTDSWSKFFDGTAKGVGAGNIDAFTILDDYGTILMSFTGPMTVPGLGTVDDSDVVRYVGAVGGPSTWTLEIDGSNLGLSSGGEDIDALSYISSGEIYLSTLGAFNVPGSPTTLAGADEDVIVFDGSPFGMHFDGSDVGMAEEDTVGLDVNPETGTIFGASLNGFSVSGLSGDGDDIWTFDGTTGSNTAGTFGLYLDLDTVRYTDNINALQVKEAPTVLPDLVVEKTNNTNGSGFVGTQFHWVLTMRNEGPVEAVFGQDDVLLVDHLPPGATYDSAALIGGFVGFSGSFGCDFQSVVFSCTVPSGLTIDPGGSIVMIIRLTPTVAGTLVNPTGGPCTIDPDNAVAESDEINNDCNSDTVVVVDAPDLTIEKTNDTPSGEVLVGSEFEWRLTLRNVGTADAVFADGDTILVDNLPGDVDYEDLNIVDSSLVVGTLECDEESADVTCIAIGEVTIQSNGFLTLALGATPEEEGTLDNPFSGGACTADPDTVVAESDETNNDCADTVVVIDAPDLAVDKGNDTGGSAFVGAPFDWTLTLRNEGSTTAGFGTGDLVLVDNLPSGATYGVPVVTNESGFSGGLSCTIDSNVLSCIVSTPGATLLSEGSVDVVVAVTPTAAGTLTNPDGGPCTADPNDLVAEFDEANNDCSDTVVVVDAPDLVVDKTNDTAGSGFVGVGFDWVLDLRNDGTGSATFAQGDLVLVDDLPAGPNYGLAAIGSFENVQAGGGLICDIQFNQLICTANANGITFFPGGNVDVTIPVTPTVAGSLANPNGTCSIDPDTVVTESNEANNDCSDTVTVVDAPDLIIEKTNNTGGGTNVSIPFDWVLTIRNQGTADAVFSENDVVLVDSLPTDATYTNASHTGDLNASGGAVCSVQSNVQTCTAGASGLTIGPGGFVEFTFTVTPTNDGELVNPDGGPCSVDPDNAIAESDESNNECPPDTVFIDP